MTKNKVKKIPFLIALMVLAVVVLAGRSLFPGQVSTGAGNYFKDPSEMNYTPRTDFNTQLEILLVAEDNLEFPGETSFIELDLINISDQAIWFPDSLYMLIGNKRKEGDTRQASFFLITDVGQELILFPEGEGLSSFRIVLRPNPEMGLSSGESLPLVIGVFGNIIENGTISETQAAAMIELIYTFP